MKKNRLKLGLGVLTVLVIPITVNAVASNDTLAAQGWVQSGASWYYLDVNGRVVRNAWIGNYWLGTDGKMVTNSWVDNGRYYVGSNGAWVKDASKDKNTKRSIFLDLGHGGSDSGAVSGGVKRASFTVLRETSIPSILVELGFIDNPEEHNKIKTNAYQERLANGIVDGIIAYYK